MNKAIYFKTSMFDVSKEEENPINPIFGKSLLLWLQNELKDKVKITDPEAEDWGWYSNLDWKGQNYLIGSIAHYEKGDDPGSEIDYVFQVDKFRSIKEKILGRNKMSETDDCFSFFRHLFEGESGFVGVEVE
jgi:hypothetical protein